MATEQEVIQAQQAITNYRDAHPLRTLTWRGQRFSKLHGMPNGGPLEFVLGIGEKEPRHHTRFYSERILHVLGDAGLSDVDVLIVPTSLPYTSLTESQP
jgi:hypothetical protein